MLSVSWRLSSIAQGLCHMHASDLLRPCQIGNRARHSQYAGITTRRKAHCFCGRSEEHTSELQSLMRISYAVFCLKKKNTSYILTQYNNATKHMIIQQTA